MTLDRIADQLRYAHSHWMRGTGRVGVGSVGRTPLSRARAEEIVGRAYAMTAVGEMPPSAAERDRALIVTKAPHTGSESTVASILARCLAFGLTVERVVPQPPSDADRIAHALYPDVWHNFRHMPSGHSTWSRIDAAFDTDSYAAIFGERYRRTAVVTGHQACRDNALTRTELMTIWQSGREPLTRAAARATYGASAVATIFGPGDTNNYQWYRGRHPIGTHKIGPGLMAFALRHDRLFGGRPVIILNGHYTLLSQRFGAGGDHGATVVQIGLDDRSAIDDVRRRLIGAADQPTECLPGTIRRDALDGSFDTDAPNDPVVAWANAVHASDGYLAGEIETATVLGGRHSGRMARILAGLGYTTVELEALIMKDPFVLAHGDEQRLTRRTAMMPRDECIATIRKLLPPLEDFACARTETTERPCATTIVG